MRKNFYAKRISATSFAIDSPLLHLHLHFETEVKITKTYLIHVTKYCANFLSLSTSNYDLTGFEEDTGAENVKEHKKRRKGVEREKKGTRKEKYQWR
jgi:CDP-diacylglycerol pyrophosphatase